MQAITTKYLGPTNFRGARIKATCEAGSITIPYQHELSRGGSHTAAATELMIKLAWDGQGLWIEGQTAKEHVFVCADPAAPWQIKSP